MAHARGRRSARGHVLAPRRGPGGRATGRGRGRAVTGHLVPLWRYVAQSSTGRVTPPSQLRERCGRIVAVQTTLGVRSGAATRPARRRRRRGRARRRRRCVAPDGRRVAARRRRRTCPPVEPTKILCCHLNHVSRVREFQIQLPPAPTYFHKPVSALNAHGGAVVRPVELPLPQLRGRGRHRHRARPRATSRSPRPRDYIAGYTIANDFGLHDFRDTDAGSMLRVKGADTLCPLGPGLVTDWDFDAQVRCSTRVNGDVRPGRLDRRDGLGHALPRRRPRAAHHARPGDVILSGTPADVAAGRARRRRRASRSRGSARSTNHIVEGPAPGERRGRRPAHRDRGGPARPPSAATGSTAASAVPLPTDARPAALPARRARGSRREPARSTSTASSVSPDHYIDGERVGVGDAPSRTARPSTGRCKLGRRRARRRRRRPTPRSARRPRRVPRLGRRSAPRSARAILHRLADLIDARRRARIADGRVPRHGDARREPARCASSRRGARNFRAYADLAAAYEPRRWDSNGTDNAVLRMPAGPDRRHHAVERAVHALDLEVRAGARRGQHRRAQARRVVAAQLLDPDATSPRRPGCRPGVFNVVQGLGEEVGAALVADPRVAAHLLHRLARDRPVHRRRGRRATSCPSPPSSGGKGPFVVFADADLDAAAAKAAR